MELLLLCRFEPDVDVCGVCFSQRKIVESQDESPLASLVHVQSSPKSHDPAVTEGNITVVECRIKCVGERNPRSCKRFSKLLKIGSLIAGRRVLPCHELYFLDLVVCAQLTESDQVVDLMRPPHIWIAYHNTRSSLNVCMEHGIVAEPS